MRCDRTIRIALLIFVSASSLGCGGLRGFFSRFSCSRCSTCVGEPIMSDVGYGGDIGCTTCQKSAITDAYPVMNEEPMPTIQESLAVPAEEQPVKPEEPTKDVTTEKKPAPPGINVDVRASMTTAMIGQEVVFDLTVANTGGSTIDKVDVVATLSPGLKAKSVTPDGVATIEGNRIVFKPVTNFAPMPIQYRILAETLPGAADGRVIVEVSSPILTRGPVKQEAVVRIAP